MNSIPCPLLKPNESIADRILRVIIGIIIIVIANYLLNGIIQTIIYGIGAVVLITGIVGFCSVYALLGISTRKTK